MTKHLGLLIAVTAAWISAAACGGTTSNPGSSSGSSGSAEDAAATACDGAPCEPETDAGSDAGPEFNTPSVCTSKANWTRGDRGSSSMHPGVACIACHDANRGPGFSIGGTVYPSAHEPDDCNGVNGGTQVVITDATGKVTTIAVNAAGNFYSQANIQTPFHAKVVSGGKERAMVGAQTDGDCNSCHTETGIKSAPGRIVAP